MMPGTSGINTLDVIAAQLHYLRVVTLQSECPLTAADVDGNNAINTSDAIAIQRFFLGRTFGIANVGTYQFTPAIHSYRSIANSQASQDFNALVLGDIVAPFTIPANRTEEDSAESSQVSSAVTEVSVPQIVQGQSKDTTLLVTSSPIDAGSNFIGFQGDLVFDERAITFQSEPIQKAGMTAGNWSVSGNVLPGKGPIRTLRVSAFSTDLTPLIGSGTLFELKLGSVNPMRHETQLTWAASPNQFIFIDRNLSTRSPATSPSRVMSSGQAAPNGKTKLE